ncbi:MAG: heavy metal-binding domain-containing protein [Bacteroidia bacterium]
MRSFILAAFILFSGKLISQGCCSGGSGSPIAGGASQGVLLDRQMELAASYQHIYTDKFLAGDRDTILPLDHFQSNYMYFRAAYGVTKDFTMSVETGYFINKTQTGIDNSDTITSSGIGDLIIFPRYDILNHTEEKKRTEITIGLGYKIPLGKYNDSTLVYVNPNTGQQYFTTSPPTIQSTNGSNDFIFYGFLYRGYPMKNFRLFSNMIYVRKGWNPLGQKFGDYASIGLFAGKTFFNKLGITLQLKGEWVGKMDYDKNIDMLALYNVDVYSTGSRKVFLVPQINYTYKSFTVYALDEIPLYQYVNRSQVASKVQLTFGISYRFFTYKSGITAPSGETSEVIYDCPMHPEVLSSVPAKCPKCGMDLVKKK